MTPTQPPSDGNAVDNPGDGNVTIAVVKNDLSHLIRIVEGFIAEQKSINKNLNDSALDHTIKIRVSLVIGVSGFLFAGITTILLGFFWQLLTNQIAIGASPSLIP